ncbi:MAG: hypothetical protein FDZ69_12410 [Deltaproteobacteria bacterium]|nr:MAG: hypothetical protein FDZ69_12410 [Deltaproteobacteria bacterium]
MAFMVRKKGSQEVPDGQAATGASSDAPEPDKAKPPVGMLARGSEERARLSCDISRSLHRRLRMAAAKNDTTIVDLIEKLIEDGTDP